MKIIMAHKYWYRRAGAEQYVFDLTELLRQEGHEVIPFAMHHPDNETTDYDEYFVSHRDVAHPHTLIDYLRNAERVMYSCEAKRVFTKLIQDTHPDLVHIHNIYHHISPSILDVCRAYHIPVVQTVHDYKRICPNYKLFTRGHIDESCKGGHYWNDIFNRSLDNSYIKSTLTAFEMYIHHTLLHIYDRAVARYICPSQFTYRTLFEFGVPKQKLVHIPYFLRNKFFSPKYAVGSYILAFGRLSSEKGFDVLIRAMQEVEFPLRLIGSGSEHTRLTQLISQYHLENRVQLIPFMKRDEIINQIQNAACVVIPSLWYEVLPFAALESYVSGKVVIAPRHGAFVELNIDGDNQFLYTPGDDGDLAKAIQRAISQPWLLEEQGRLLYEHVAKLCDEDDHYSRLASLYESILCSDV